MTIYSASVPAFAQILRGLDSIITKASAYAEAKKIAPDVMLGLRLAPDMFGLARQVQIACDFAKNTSGRLAGVELPKFADDEKTFDELHARIAKTLSFIEGLPAASFKGAENKSIEFPMRGKPHVMQADAYLNTFALPNFYFHITAAYSILRANGLEIGKGDYMGKIEGIKAL
jgi:uncharacterized protein